MPQLPNETQVIILSMTSGVFIAVFPDRIQNAPLQREGRVVVTFDWNTVSETVRDCIRDRASMLINNGYAYLR